MSNILVTGGAGYIGSVCAETLLAHGLRTVIIDNLSEGNRSAVPVGAIFINADIGDNDALEFCFSKYNIDVVMHFAGEALVEKSMRDPSVFYLANVARGITLLDAMSRHGVSKMIYSSTCAVYGEPKSSRLSEAHEKQPINPYGLSKMRFEQVLEDYGRYANMHSVILRYFNAAGASESRGENHRTETHLIPRILAVAAGEDSHVEVRGSDYPTVDGTCVRDFIHVLDIASAHLRALEYLDEAKSDIFNIGIGRGYSVLEIIEIARQVTGRSIRIKFSDRRPGDPSVLVADSSKIRKTLGWLPKHSSMEELIMSAWSWKLAMPTDYRWGQLPSLEKELVGPFSANIAIEPRHSTEKGAFR